MKASRHRKRHLFATLFLSVLLISLLPILFLSASFYYKSYQDAVETVSAFQKTYIADFTASLEENIFASINSANGLAMRSALLDYDAFPNIGYYEQAFGPFSTELLQVLYDYLEVKSACLDELAAFRRAGDHYLFVEYLQESSDIVLTSGTYSYPLSERTDDLPWYQWYESVREGNGALSVIPIPKNESGVYNRPLLLVASRLAMRARRVTVIIYVDQSSMFAAIVRKLPDVSERGTLTIESGGETVFSHDFNGGLRDDRRKTSSRKVSTINRPVSILEWSVSLSITKEGYIRRLGGIRVIMFLSAALVLIVTIASVFLSAQISGPLIRLVGKLGATMTGSRLTGTGPAGSSVRGGVEFIERGVIELIDEKSSLERQISAGKPIYRENFLRGLLYGDVYAAEELESQFAFLGVNLDIRDFLVILISYVHGTVSGDLGAMRVVIEQTKREIRNVLGRRVRGVAVELSRNRIAIVTNATSRTVKPIIELSESLFRVLHENDGISVNIGIGYPHEEATRIRTSFEEAEEASMYAAFQSPDEGSVLFIGDIRLIRTQPFIYPEAQEDALGALIMSGNTEGAIETFQKIVDEMRDQSLALGRYRIHHVIIRLMNTIYDKYGEIDSGFEVPIDEYSKIIKTMEEGGEEVAVKHLLCEIENLTGHIRGKRIEKEQLIVNQVCELIERDYRTISLATVSDELSISPSMVSRLFKQVMGTGFSDYLTKHRVSRGIELLKQGNLSIHEISRAVGYSNSNYFIKLFKAQKGVTPGEFRKLLP